MAAGLSGSRSQSSRSATSSNTHTGRPPRPRTSNQSKDKRLTPHMRLSAGLQCSVPLGCFLGEEPDDQRNPMTSALTISDIMHWRRQADRSAADARQLPEGALGQPRRPGPFEAVRYSDLKPAPAVLTLPTRNGRLLPVKCAGASTAEVRGSIPLSSTRTSVETTVVSPVQDIDDGSES